jgi:spoIIIJ-associated protein
MGFIGKLFGGGDKKAKGPKALIEQILNGLIEKGGFDFSFDLEEAKDQDIEAYKVNFYGNDEEMLTQKDGMLLEAIQLFVKRALQHHFPDTPVNLMCDSNDYRTRENENLEAMIEKLKQKVLAQGRPVYVKALPPKERRVVHQFLSKDERVKSRSIGDGHYKKIKIYTAGGAGRERDGGGEAAAAPNED